MEEPSRNKKYYMHPPSKQQQMDNFKSGNRSITSSKRSVARNAKEAAMFDSRHGEIMQTSFFSVSKSD
jgi:hypothetical protein